MKGLELIRNKDRGTRGRVGIRNSHGLFFSFVWLVVYKICLTVWITVVSLQLPKHAWMSHDVTVAVNMENLRAAFLLCVYVFFLPINPQNT